MHACTCKCLCREETALAMKVWYTPSSILVLGSDVDGCSPPVQVEVPICIECQLGWHKKEPSLEDLDDMVGKMCKEDGGIVIDLSAIKQRVADEQPRVYTGVIYEDC